MTGSGKDENKRAPMFWTTDSRISGMTNGPADMEPQEHRFAGALDQMKDPFTSSPSTDSQPAISL